MRGCTYVVSHPLIFKSERHRHRKTDAWLHMKYLTACWFITIPVAEVKNGSSLKFIGFNYWEKISSFLCTFTIQYIKKNK
jgi:hypothetical protein